MVCFKRFWFAKFILVMMTVFQLPYVSVDATTQAPVRHTTGHGKGTTGGHKTTAKGHHTTVGGHRTTAGARHTTAGGHRTTGHGKGTTGGHHTTSGGRHTTVRTTGHGKGTTGEHRTTGHGKGTTGGHHTTSGGHRTTSGGRHTTVSSHRTTGHGKGTTVGHHTTAGGRHTTGHGKGTTAGHRTTAGGHHTTSSPVKHTTGAHKAKTTAKGKHTTSGGGHPVTTGRAGHTTASHHTTTHKPEHTTGLHHQTKGKHTTPGGLKHKGGLGRSMVMATEDKQGGEVGHGGNPKAGEKGTKHGQLWVSGVSETLSFANANESCSKMGGGLVTFVTQGEIENIGHILKRVSIETPGGIFSFWIGASNRERHDGREGDYWSNSEDTPVDEHSFARNDSLLGCIEDNGAFTVTYLFEEIYLCRRNDATKCRYICKVHDKE